MKNPILRFLALSITFIIIIYNWRSNGTTKEEYWSNFDVMQGALQGPYVVASVHDFLYINHKPWGEIKDELDLGEQSYLLDSILSPFHKNQLSELTDTLYQYTNEEWNNSKQFFESLALKLDTFIVIGNKHFPLLIEQKPVMELDYHILTQGDERYCTISTYEFEDVDQWDWDEETPLQEFLIYKSKVDSVLASAEYVKITVLKKGNSNWRKPYIISDENDKQLFYDEEGFERLESKGRFYFEPNEDFILWYDNWMVKFLIVIFSFAIFISFLLMFSEPVDTSKK